MKKLLLIMVLAVVFVLPAQAQDSKPIVMKLGHFAADAHPGNLASKMFAEAVEKRTNGTSKSSSIPTMPWAPLPKSWNRTSWARWT